ncbi:hypothetical protein KY311_02300 [Candidatus Woesearchaeota archaeon]|nr:hypothetical protein [Candidatus Woesearchaeota archaeon]
MAKKEDQVIKKLAKDVEFLKEAMLGPEAALPEKLRKLEEQNKELILENNVLNDEKKLLIEANRRFERDKKTASLLVQGFGDMKLKLASKQEIINKQQEEIQKFKDFVVDLRDKELGFELDDKKKTKQLGEIMTKLKHEIFKKNQLMNRFVETRKILEQQIMVMNNEKEKTAAEKIALLQKIEKLLDIVEKQDYAVKELKKQYSEKLQIQKQRYDEMIRRLNEVNMKEVLDKNATMIALQKKMKMQEDAFRLKLDKQKRMVKEFEDFLHKQELQL